MTGSTNIDNIIISGVRIYFPPDSRLPDLSSDMLTFAVMRDADVYFLLIRKSTGWELASSQIFKETVHAISTAITISRKEAWR